MMNRVGRCAFWVSSQEPRYLVEACRIYFLVNALRGGRGETDKVLSLPVEFGESGVL